LGMVSSRLVDPEGGHEDLPNMSHAYTRKDEVVVEFERSHLRRLFLDAPAGGMLSTASDMAKYVQFHKNGGRVAGIQIVPEVIKRIFKAYLFLAKITLHNSIINYGLIRRF